MLFNIPKRMRITSERLALGHVLFFSSVFLFRGLQLQVCEAVAEKQGGNQLFPMPLVLLQSIVAVHFMIHHNQSRIFGAKITEQFNCTAGR
jgi:hypothetical protein